MPFAYDNGADGLRRCFPEGLYIGTEGAEEWTVKAFTIGLAILSRVQNMTAEQVRSYRTMAVLFAYRSAFGEHQARRFARSGDLYITPSGREDQHAPESRTVLSTLATLDKLSRPLSVSQFMKSGKEAAQSRGILDPTAEQQIQYGFLRWAEEQARGARPPTAGELAARVRSALLKAGLTDGFVQKVHGHPVVPRLMKGIEEHIDDRSEDFGRWFRNAVSRGFVHLAAQKRAPSGALPGKVARQVVLALVWRAYQYVGDCVHAFMYTVRRSFDPPMSGDESELFDRNWLRQDVFGGLPLILVRERLHFMWPAVAPWLDSPRTTLRKEIVYWMLYAYAATSYTRRKADKQRKKVVKHPEYALLPEPGAPQPTAEEMAIKKPLEALLESRSVRCHKCGQTTFRLVDQEQLPEGMIRLNLECVSCHAMVPHDCPVETLRDGLADVWRGIR
jgi:hypothetical protein